MEYRFRQRLALVFLTGLAIWPIIHMALSELTGLNSWKLFGWGMYATTRPIDKGVVCLLMEESTSMPELEVLLGRPRVYLVSTQGVEEVNVRRMDRETLVVFFEAMDYLRVLRRDQDVGNVMNVLREALAEKEGFESVYGVLLISELRINLRDRYTYVETRAYLYRDGDVRWLGTFSSEEYGSAEFVAQIRSQIATSRI